MYIDPYFDIVSERFSIWSVVRIVTTDVSYFAKYFTVW